MSLTKRTEIEDAPVNDRERLARLRDHLSKAPLSPGVYLHKDEKGKILYVGKAKILQNRLRSYFTGLERHTPKTRALVSRIFDFEVIVVDNENESLLLENNLIKHHQPPYNILLRDDKHYPYLRLDLNESWPRLVTTRKRKNDGAVYFGPYSSGAELYRITGVVNRFFKLIKCSPQVFRTVQRPCNYFDVKKCLGPCKLPVDRSDYQEEVDKVVQILRGKSGALIEVIKKQMFKAAEGLNFEKAANLRDQAKALETLQGGQAVAFQPGFNADVISYFVEGEKLSIFVSILRDGKAIGGESHILNTNALVSDQETILVEGQIIGETLEAYLGQFYASHEIPDFICVPLSKPLQDLRQGNALSELQYYLLETKRLKNSDPLATVVLVSNTAFPSAKEHAGEVKKILKESYKLLLETGFENAKNRLLEKLTIDEKSQSELSQLQQFLEIQKLPTWMECYDISTFQGSQNVASGVVFRNGRPAKSDYRKYIIRDVEGQDDFASLREVTRRRFHEEKKLEVPDVFLVDGGEPQVREVAYVLKSLGLDHVPLFGIAKSRNQSSYQSVSVKQSQERVLFPCRENGFLVPEKSPRTEFLEVGSAPYRLLTQIRDEAHRFAITFHRKKRDQKTKSSALNEIKGVGVKTRKLLLLAFGSVGAIRSATEEDIKTKTNLSASIIKKIKKAINEPDTLGLFLAMVVGAAFSTVNLSCRNRTIQMGAEPFPTAIPPANRTEGSSSSVTGVQKSVEKSGELVDWKIVVEDICANDEANEKRSLALKKLSTYKLGSRSVSLDQMKQNKQACADELKLSGLYVNLVSGIPMGTLLGQAIQETGFCASDLAQQANSFHGMKATVDKSNFTHWDGAKFTKSSSESVTGSGNEVVSGFMKFSHLDYSFYAVAERMLISTLPYKSCLSSRQKADDFMRCVGKSWAVHGKYAEAVLKHRADFKLAPCELSKAEWLLDPKWQ